MGEINPTLELADPPRTNVPRTMCRAGGLWFRANGVAYWCNQPLKGYPAPRGIRELFIEIAIVLFSDVWGNHIF